VDQRSFTSRSGYVEHGSRAKRTRAGAAQTPAILSQPLHRDLPLLFSLFPTYLDLVMLDTESPSTGHAEGCRRLVVVRAR